MSLLKEHPQQGDHHLSDHWTPYSVMGKEPPTNREA